MKTGVTVTMKVPLFIVSSVLVAVTTTTVWLAACGAVSKPDVEIVPAEADQLTVWLKFPVPIMADMH